MSLRYFCGISSKVKITLFLSFANLLESNASSLVKASGETSTETSTETQNQIAAKRGTLTLENIQIQPGEESQSQVVDKDEIPSVEKPQTQATTESTDLTRDETQIQPSEETYTPKTTTESTCILDTEYADISFSEINKTEDTKESKSSILNGKGIYFY